MTTQVMLFSQETGALISSGDLSLLNEWQPEQQRIWINLNNDNSEDARRLLEERFQVPSLMVDDALRSRHPPKFERNEVVTFLLLRGLDKDTNSIKFSTIPVALFFGDNWLVTRHAQPSVSIEYVRGLVENGSVDCQHIGALVYRLCRKVHDRFMPIVLDLEDRLETIEDELLDHPSDTLLKELMLYSRELKRLRRISDYHHRLYLRLEKVGFNSDELQHELTDLTEQSERLLSLSQLFQDITNDLINGYISVSSHRLNQIMKVLTIVTVIFVPLTFMAGIYGMNFEYIPELKWKYSYFVLLGVMLGSGIGLLALFRHKKWI